MAEAGAGIRRAAAGDVAAVAEVTAAAYRPYVPVIGVEPAPMRAEHAADVAAGLVWVTGEPVHGVLVLVAHRDHLLLASVAVRPEAHGRGVGGRLIAFAQERARALGLPEVRLYTHELMGENRSRYRRLGFEETGRSRSGPYRRVHFRKRVVDTPGAGGVTGAGGAPPGADGAAPDVR
ncbi:GNAT family N-acetyltransferase [Streptomyces sp. NPDC050560]|uniref:GNAT family N-acetyltransferase n=1 Tax=Streptomyces sp. NPDC050560 TaxID=3365630 RepID=UPI00378ADD49